MIVFSFDDGFTMDHPLYMQVLSLSLSKTCMHATFKEAVSKETQSPLPLLILTKVLKVNSNRVMLKIQLTLGADLSASFIAITN